MKKQKLALLAIVAAVMTVLATPSSAFQSVQIATRAASVLTGGSLSASFTLKIRNTNDPLNPAVDLATITWSGVTPPTTQWKIADQLMVLVATVTDGNGGVQIYTNNKASDSSYSFVDPTPGITNNPDSDPAGLLKVPVAGTTTTSALSMAWSIKAATQTVGTTLLAADPNTGPTTGPGNKFQWLFMEDKNTPPIDFNGDAINDTTGFINGDTFVTMIKTIGIHTGQGPTDFQAQPNGVPSYVYFQSNFTPAQAQTAYQTNTLRVEAFIQ
jgi:hypothetical protein